MDEVWFYDLDPNGLSLDDKRSLLVPEDKIGPWAELTRNEAKLNNLPDAIARWHQSESTEKDDTPPPQKSASDKPDAVQVVICDHLYLCSN
ncbi:hypothetical protein [Paracoccus sp. S1E-3]|uniref:hypothetical protein n=1 Tax=Paracoccus sp. S1E-3 TaxID=2756130 RepID=UPI0015EF9B38|nr:hypothetical protein [Paracoccus sp. S1E-3]MBA4489797.1 hypothetical protein [Paracoccus sp. S1E-3]